MQFTKHFNQHLPSYRLSTCYTNYPIAPDKTARCDISYHFDVLGPQTKGLVAANRWSNGKEHGEFTLYVNGVPCSPYTFLAPKDAKAFVNGLVPLLSGVEFESLPDSHHKLLYNIVLRLMDSPMYKKSVTVVSGPGGFWQTTYPDGRTTYRLPLQVPVSGGSFVVVDFEFFCGHVLKDPPTWSNGMRAKLGVSVNGYLLSDMLPDEFSRELGEALLPLLVAPHEGDKPPFHPFVEPLFAYASRSPEFCAFMRQQLANTVTH